MQILLKHNVDINAHDIEGKGRRGESVEGRGAKRKGRSVVVLECSVWCRGYALEMQHVPVLLYLFINN